MPDAGVNQGMQKAAGTMSHADDDVCDRSVRPPKPEIHAIPKLRLGTFQADGVEQGDVDGAN